MPSVDHHGHTSRLYEVGSLLPSISGYWWGNLTPQCTKERRTGESCGLKLISPTFNIHDHCRICSQLDIESRRVRKMGKISTDGKGWDVKHHQSSLIAISKPTLHGSQEAFEELLLVLVAEGYRPFSSPEGFHFDRAGSTIFFETVREEDLRAWNVSSIQAYYVRTSITTDDLQFMTGKHAVMICPELAAKRKFALLKGKDDAELPVSELNKASRKLLMRGMVAVNHEDCDLQEVQEMRSVGDKYCRVISIENTAPKDVPQEERLSVCTDLDASEFSIKDRLIRI
ncbi:hypothetical protein JX265_013987 [Neoarthrinium moseri]|uniref:Uncharacterized protein n=1 Tax=Neoarthrinium moseri TaxID=1658444 RepID=A0A9P9W7L7_9PEZI|nr:hypothetical protein JX265_013987 [Neoarthrinium moseri]